MIVSKRETMNIDSENDIVKARHMARLYAQEIGLRIIDQTKLVTAVSELARNTYLYAKDGNIQFETVTENDKVGIKVIFEDKGPGIPDLKLALTDGYSTGNGLGYGLSGAKRLVNQFEIKSDVLSGTRIKIIQWK